MDRYKRTMRIIPHMTSRNKGDAEYGLESLARDFEFGHIVCPYGDADSRAMTELLFEEARSYPEAQYDDILMALWFVKWNWRQLLPDYVEPAEQAGGYEIPAHLTKLGYGQPRSGSYDS
jgi:hypothetical protein